MPRWLAWSGLTLLVLAVLGIGAALWRNYQAPDPKLLADAGKALAEKHPGDALRLAQEYLARDSTSTAARLIAADASQQQGKKEEALAILAEVSAEDTSAEAVRGAVLAGNVCIDLGRAWEAEKHFRHALSLDPKDIEANRRLVFLLTVEGRRWESRPFLLKIVEQRQFTKEELIIFGDPWPVYEYRAEVDRLMKEQPNDPLPLLVLARMQTRFQEMPKARRMLQKVIKNYPDLVEAHAWIGWTLTQDKEGSSELAEWEKALPASAADHPMIWIVRGMGAEHLGQREAAVRCFWEALKRDPNYDLAAYRLSHALGVIQQGEAAALVRRRADVLLDLAATLKTVHREGRSDAATYRQIAEKMESLGRFREAWAWYLMTSAQHPMESWALVEVNRLEGKLSAAPCLTLTEAEPNLKLDFSKYPLPNWPKAASPAVAGVKVPPASPVRFANAALSAGIDFTYFNGDGAGLRRILGDIGGGVAVLDYDGDLWPDLYFTQGCEFPVKVGDTTHRDRLYRNLGNGSFEDVTMDAGLGDTSYSQGVSAGDFDNDGLVDLYLGNVGVNRLYHNNGDGTFTDVTEAARITSGDWTTSCMIADVSGDGLPDLFDVNYLEGDALTRICPNGPCGPHLFPGQQDRLLLNWGDGTFRDVTSVGGINGKNGKGLGIVAADFGGTGRLNLFVANDTTPNFYYENLSQPGESLPKFNENGVLSGLAYDRNGLPQACMGVAVDDANGDGFPELYVTNFYQESNTFYVAEVPGQSYSDQTSEFGLRDSSLEMLGFGTQFIDGELDGWPDLILTNGHVQDRSKEGIAFQMPPQFHRNLGGEGFEELKAETLGPFFAKKFLGRGLARLDWNRDGREEVVISHIGDKAALLTNETSPAGHFITLQLRGITGNRDGIGAIAKIKVGERTITRQLTAGDGYQASNHRQLVFGLGSAERAEQLEIRWLSGITQTFANVEADSQYIAVEGGESLVKLDIPTPESAVGEPAGK